MGKNTRKQPAPRKSKYTMLSVSSPTLLALAKRKFICKDVRASVAAPHPHKIDSLVN